MIQPHDLEWVKDGPRRGDEVELLAEIRSLNEEQYEARLTEFKERYSSLLEYGPDYVRSVSENFRDAQRGRQGECCLAIAELLAEWWTYRRRMTEEAPVQSNGPTAPANS